jgi:hypothetical protein
MRLGLSYHAPPPPRRPPLLPYELLPALIGAVEFDALPQYEPDSITSGLFDAVKVLGSAGGTVAATGADRPVEATVLGGGEQRRVAAFGGSQLMDHSGAAADWSALTGPSTIAAVFSSDLVANATIIATGRMSGVASVGFELFLLAGGELYWRVADGVGWIVNTHAPVLLPGVMHYAVCVLSATAFAMYVDGALVASGVPGRTPTALTPDSTLRIGGATTSGNLLVGDVGLVSAYATPLSAPKRQALETYCERYSQSYNLSKGGPSLFLAPCLGAVVSDPGAPSPSYAALTGLEGAGRNFTTTTQAKEPAVTTTPSGLPAADFDGTDDALGLVASALPFNVGDDCHIIHALVRQDDDSGATDYLLDAQTGRLVFAPLAVTSGKSGWYDGTWKSVASAVSGWKLDTWYLDGVGGVGRYYENGVQRGEGSYTARALGGAVVVGSDYLQTGYFFDGALALLHARSAATAPDGATAFLDLQEISALEPTLTTLAQNLSCIGTVADIDTSDAGNFVLDAALDSGGAEELTNGDFETGDMTGWSVVNAAILSAETGTPYEGVYCGRVTYDGTSNPGMSQATVANAWYHVKGRARGDGTGKPKIISSATVWTGTTSTDWQEFDVYFQTTTTIIVFGSVLASAGHVEYDVTSLREVRPVRVVYDVSKDFDEAVDDGGFDTGTPWTAGTHWSIGAGVATAAGALAAEELEQGCITANRGLLTYTATVSANSVTPYAGTVAGTAQTAGGTFYDVIDSDGTDLKFGGHASGFSGTIDNVSWKRGNHAFSVAGSRPTYDAVNKCMVFGGTHYLIGVAPPSGSSGEFSIWFKSSDKSSTQVIFGCNDAVPNRFWINSDITTGYAKVYCGSNHADVNVDICDGQWHQLTGSFSGSLIYCDVDGVEASQTLAGAIPTVDIYVGARNNNGSVNNQVNGCIAAVGMFSRRRSAAERADWFEKHKPPGAP